jgi:hypothetical protein
MNAGYSIFILRHSNKKVKPVTDSAIIPKAKDLKYLMKQDLKNLLTKRKAKQFQI